MDPRVLRLASPEDCVTFARNAIDRGHPDLAAQARQRAVQLRAATAGASSQAEKECLEAIFAYEETLFIKHGKRVKASRTWQAIDNKSILQAVDDMVSKEHATVGYDALVKAGLHEFAFEAVVLRHPKLFSDAAKQNAARRMADWKQSQVRT